jgi:branched-subunit amino acid ABC-type transport system permease component
VLHGPISAGPTPPSSRYPSWTSSIASILLLDGVTNGAIYALLGLATVLVFTVTRVIFIPQGEFVAYGALTLGHVPGWQNTGYGVAAADPRRHRPR